MVRGGESTWPDVDDVDVDYSFFPLSVVLGSTGRKFEVIYHEIGCVRMR